MNVIEKLFTYFNLKNAGLKRSNLAEQNIIVYTIINFMPALEPCNICYTKLHPRQKCKECVFILCAGCSPNISHKCPHCQRNNTYPGMNFKQSEALVTRNFSEWSDNPFGPIFNNFESTIPIFRLNTLPQTRTCPFCRETLSGNNMCFCLRLPRSETLATPMLLPEIPSLHQRTEPIWNSRVLHPNVVSNFAPRYQIPRYECFCNTTQNTFHSCPFGPLCQLINDTSSRD